MSGTNSDQITLLVNGKVFAGWLEITVSRALDRLKSVFSIAVTDAWVTNGQLWQITPFSPCVVKIGTDTVLTGYVDEYAPDFDQRQHRVTIRGASKTGDLVECTPDISSGQFKGYTLEQIARAICAPFTIGVMVQTDASQIFPDATLQRGETAFTFLERLGRLAGVLLTDDQYGNLVLATTGTTRASGRLVQGQNIIAASAMLNVEKRFSVYIVKGQKALGSTVSSWEGANGGSTGSPPAPVQTSMRATATDSGVPRYRPKISIAEAQLDQAGMQRRANWECAYAAGRAAQADITVAGWRQPDNTLWQPNTLVSVNAPFLQLQQDMLIVETTFSIAPGVGKRTKLRVGPPSGYTPDPGEVKLHSKKGKGGSAPNWSGVTP
jgi:prophage tail gpP-like protein